MQAQDWLQFRPDFVDTSHTISDFVQLGNIIQSVCLDQTKSHRCVDDDWGILHQNMYAHLNVQPLIILWTPYNDEPWSHRA